LYVSLTLICTFVLYALCVTLVLYISGFVVIVNRVLGFGVQLVFQHARIQQPQNTDTLQFSTPEIRYHYFWKEVHVFIKCYTGWRDLQWPYLVCFTIGTAV